MVLISGDNEREKEHLREFFPDNTEFLFNQSPFNKLKYIRDLKDKFILSFLYNIIGLSFAVQGILSPVIAAILMPLSSVSVVLFATFATNSIAYKRGLL